MKTTLLEILWKKELIHWRRMKQVFGKFNWFGKLIIAPLVVILVTLTHYAFALMHTMFELCLYAFARQAFKYNLQKLALKV